MTPSGFFAYPSQPPSAGDAIVQAIEEVNHGHEVFIKPWSECSVTGKLIIDEICKEIDAADFFCADLTGINPNVMFELGYAIAKNKRIWTILDSSRSNLSRDFIQAGLLSTVGYASYCSSVEIVKNFYSDRPHESLNDTIFERSIRPSLREDATESILYLKSRYDNEGSVRLSNRIQKSKIPLIVDDPAETAAQSLTWFGMQAYSASCVICHFDHPDRTEAGFNNARHALACGMAFGLEKPFLMLCEEGYLTPMDYRDFLKHYKKSREALKYLEDWLVPIENAYSERQAKAHLGSTASKLAKELRGLQVGEYVAENEREFVDDYFIETAAYLEALKGGTRIFVGRKGTGKTANMLTLASTLTSDSRNLVCLIQPAGYELQGIVNLLRKYKELDAKGFAIESLWKLLIYTEIANAAAALIESRLALTHTPDEIALLQILDRKDLNLREDFSIRLESCVEALSGLGRTDSVASARQAISEALHSGLLKDLRECLGKLLKGNNRVAVLVDNLDKSWSRHSDFSALSEVLLGLLTAINRISTDFNSARGNRDPVNLMLSVFLRADIFDEVMQVAREPDKIVYSRLVWRDPEELIRVIEERFQSARGGNVHSQELWTRYFVPTVGDMPIQEFLTSCILPRPRDIVYLVKAAVANAVNRRHTRVEEKDITDARKQYSEYAKDSIVVEDSLTGGKLEHLLYEFVGGSSVLSETVIRANIEKVIIENPEIDGIIEHLCNLTFLGVEVGDNDFRFAEDPSDFRKIEVLSRKYCEANGKTKMYKIHEAFHPLLEIAQSTLKSASV